MFLNALLWMTRTGAAWRDLPNWLGKWNVAYQRFVYWCGKGYVERLFQGVQQPDMQEVMMASTRWRAHCSSAVELLDGLQGKALLTDKAYDSEKIFPSAWAQGMQIIIACRVNRKKQRVLD